MVDINEVGEVADETKLERDIKEKSEAFIQVHDDIAQARKRFSASLKGPMEDKKLLQEELISLMRMTGSSWIRVGETTYIVLKNPKRVMKMSAKEVARKVNEDIRDVNDEDLSDVISSSVETSMSGGKVVSSNPTLVVSKLVAD